MTTTTSGAVGFAPVGTFVQDLAKEVGKSAATVAAYIKKHLPTALIKRKNSNNRQANFATEQAVEAVRTHYLTKVSGNSSLLQELERLRAENEQLRSRVEELEAANADLETRAVSKNRKQKYTKEDFARWQEPDAFDEGIELIKGMTEELKQQAQTNWREANDKRRIHGHARGENRRTRGEGELIQGRFSRTSED